MKAIVTKFLPATDYRGSRVKATEPDGKSVTLSYDHGLTTEQNHRVAAETLCQRMKWEGRLICGGLKYGYAFVFAENLPCWNCGYGPQDSAPES